MRVIYNVYSRKRATDEPHEEDLDLWIKSWLQTGGIEVQLKKVRDLAILFTEELLARHPEKIGQIAYILDADGLDHRIEP